MLWLLVVFATILLGYLVLVRPLQYWQRLGIPQKSVWENWLDFGLELVQYFCMADATKRSYDDFPGKRYGGIYQFFKPVLIVRDPDLIKRIMVKDFEHFVDHADLFPETSDPLWGRNVFFLKGKQWKEMRVTLNPFFTSSKMKMMFNMMSDCSKQFVKYFEEQATHTTTIEIEMKDVSTRYANDVIAITAFGITCDSMRQQHNDFYLMGKEATIFGEGIWDSFKFQLRSVFPKLTKMIGLGMEKVVANNYFKNTIKACIKWREEGGIVRPDMIHLLLEARREKLKNAGNPQPLEKFMEDNFLTDDDIAAQAFIFYLAGFEAIANVMVFMAYELALQPELLKSLQNEIDDVRDKYGEDLSYDNLSELKYMDMVIYETLRKWPGIILIDRVCVKPYTIEAIYDREKTVRLPEGSLINIPLFGLQRDPDLHPNPECFDPERFSGENKYNMHRYSALGFGVGPRVCIAVRYAMIEMKVVFFYLLAKFDIVSIAKTPVPLKLMKKILQLEPEGGFWVGLKPRDI